MQKPNSIPGYDGSYLMDEQRYRGQTAVKNNKPKLNKDYFTVDGDVIRDYNDETLDPFDSVMEFDGFYFAYGDVDNFINWLIDNHVYGLHQLYDAMTPTGKREFLKNGFENVSNEFQDLFEFEDVERS